jgi:hypothetical protein
MLKLFKALLDNSDAGIHLLLAYAKRGCQAYDRMMGRLGKQA